MNTGLIIAGIGIAFWGLSQVLNSVLSYYNVRTDLHNRAKAATQQHDLYLQQLANEHSKELQ